MAFIIAALMAGSAFAQMNQQIRMRMPSWIHTARMGSRPASTSTRMIAVPVMLCMALPGGIATVVCVKPVPVGAKDFVMCTDKAEKADDDDDAATEATMQKMMKQGQEMLDRLKKK